MSDTVRTKIRFPKLYSRAVSLLNADLKPSHFFDLLILALVAAAFLAATVTMGVISQANSGAAPRLVAAALALHAMAQIARSRDGLRIRWGGLVFLPFALWVLFDRGHAGVAWKAREQFAVAVTAVAAFWIVVHHIRHEVHRWFLLAVLSATGAAFGALMISKDKNLLPKLAHRVADGLAYDVRMTGPFGTPGIFAAFLLLTLFPAAAVMLSHNGSRGRRIAGLLAVPFGLIGFVGAQHGPAWCGLCAGGALLCWILQKNRIRAAILVAVFAGLAFVIPKAGFFDTGLFRGVRMTEHLDVKPLAGTATDMLRAHPLTGIGSGGFASSFEAVRPAGWTLDPQGAGGLFHQIGAENGAVGLALLLLPAVVLWFFALKHCLATPRREAPVRRRERSLVTPHTLPRRVPEVRIALAGILSGTLAATVALACDHAAPSFALAIAFAIVGGIASRMTTAGAPVTTITPEPKPAFALRAIPAVAVIAAFALAVYPVCESASRAAFAEDLIADAESSAVPGMKPQVLLQYRLNAIDTAEIAARLALELEPDNARAAAALARAHLARLQFSGKDDAIAEGLDAARLAARISGNEVVHRLPLSALLIAAGDTAGAEKELRSLHAGTPCNEAVSLILARNLLDRGDAAGAAALIADVLGKNPWNAEAKKLADLAKLARPGAAPANR